MGEYRKRYILPTLLRMFCTKVDWWMWENVRWPSSLPWTHKGSSRYTHCRDNPLNVGDAGSQIANFFEPIIGSQIRHVESPRVMPSAQRSSLSARHARNLSHHQVAVNITAITTSGRTSCSPNIFLTGYLLNFLLHLLLPQHLATIVDIEA